MNVQASLVAAPPAPKRLEEMELPLPLMRDLTLKAIFRKSVNTVTSLAEAICLPVPVTQELVDLAREQKLLEATGTMSAISSGEMGYQLTENGRARALDALKQSEYYGAMPVPMRLYREQVERQSVRKIFVTYEQLSQSMADLVITDTLLRRIGPAVSSGRSMLLYGPPGNGKSSISSGIIEAIGDKIYVPRAIEFAGEILTVFDPLVHKAAEELYDDPNSLRRTSNRFDSRYVRCHRPAVVTGGELTLNMLDLVYDPVARTYQAPLQLKSNGGIFIIDDLGRQKENPQALVNRWIVPLEEGKDILQLQSGESFEVPFDTLVIFSTNFHPKDIFDDAALRRIFYKIPVPGPNQEDFLKIFAHAARITGIPLDEASLVHLLTVKYAEVDFAYANFHPLYLLEQIQLICDFEGLPYKMTPDLVDRAWTNLFVE